MIPQSDIRRRLGVGLASQGYGQVVQLLIRFCEVPLLLYFWGPQLYGEWLMLAAIPAYLAIGDGGFAGAASRDMGMKSSAGDRAGTLAVFQSTACLLALVSAALLLVALPLIQFAPLRDWLGFQQMTTEQASIVLAVLIVHVLVGFQGGLINGGFWCSGRYPLGMALAATTQLLEFAALAAVVILGGGPAQAALAYLAGRCVGTVITRFVLWRATPWLSYGLSHASVRELRRLAVPAFASLAFPLGNALNIQGMRLIVGLVLGPASVAVFAPIRTLTRLALQPVNIVNRLIIPEMGMTYGKGDIELFESLFIRSCQVSLWMSLFASLILVGVGDWLLPMWTAGKVEMDWPLFLLLAGAAVVNAMWYTALMVPYATNRHGRIAVYYSLIYGAVAFSLVYVGTKFFGYIGLGIVLLMAEVVMAWLVVSVALRLSGYSWSQWAKSIGRPPVFLLQHGLVVLRNIRV